MLIVVFSVPWHMAGINRWMKEGRNKLTPNGSERDPLILVCSRWQPFRPLATSNILHHLFIKPLTSTFFIPWMKSLLAILVHYISHFTHSEYSLPELKPEAILALNSKTKFHKDSIFQSVFPRKGYLLHYRKDHWAASSYQPALVYKFTTYFTWEFYYYIR